MIRCVHACAYAHARSKVAERAWGRGLANPTRVKSSDGARPWALAEGFLRPAPALPWVVAPVFRALLQLVPLQLDAAPHLYAGYLPAFRPAVDPALAHSQLLADHLGLGGAVVVPPGSGGAPFPSFLAPPPPGLLRTPTACFRTLRGPGKGSLGIA